MIMDKARHVYHHGWMDTQSYRRVDSFLVNRLGRPTREERFANRSKALKEGLKAAVYGGSFLVGTGKVRVGKLAVSSGSRSIRSLSSYIQSSWFVRTAGKRARESIPGFLAASDKINQGIRTMRHGRILQGAGLGGLLFD